MRGNRPFQREHGPKRSPAVGFYGNATSEGRSRHYFLPLESSPHTHTHLHLVRQQRTFSWDLGHPALSNPGISPLTLVATARPPADPSRGGREQGGGLCRPHGKAWRCTQAGRCTAWRPRAPELTRPWGAIMPLLSLLSQWSGQEPGRFGLL